MASTPVIFRVKQFKEDSILNDVGERATVFRNVGNYLLFYRISQAARIQAPFFYTQLIWLRSTAAYKLSASVNGILLPPVISTALHVTNCCALSFRDGYVTLRLICRVCLQRPLKYTLSTLPHSAILCFVQV